MVEGNKYVEPSGVIFYNYIPEIKQENYSTAYAERDKHVLKQY